ncbi:glycosyltransferase family 2 protein [Candidatus Parcubacteria bacterium]|nr:glycosyltransferase family 2 protein [Candidatus Parcubacteria bacterium]
MNPKITILVLNWNGGPDTIACLNSFKDLRYPNFRVIVLDNASSDDSWKRFAQYPTPPYRIAFVQTGANLGFGGGNNVGIKRALTEGTDYIFFLNNDTVLAPDALAKMVAAAAADPQIGLVGALMLTTDEPARIWFCGGRFNWLRTRGFHPHYGEPYREGMFPEHPLDVDYITGGALLAKRRVFEEVGLLPEDYFLYYEDADFNARAAAAGWRRVVVPSAKVWHKGSASAKAGSPSYQYYHLRNGLTFSWRHGPSRVLTLAASLWLAAKEFVKIVIGYHRVRSIGGLHGVIDFWRGRNGARKSRPQKL